MFPWHILALKHNRHQQSSLDDYSDQSVMLYNTQRDCFACLLNSNFGEKYHENILGPGIQ